MRSSATQYVCILARAGGGTSMLWYIVPRLGQTAPDLAEAALLLVGIGTVWPEARQNWVDLNHFGHALWAMSTKVGPGVATSAWANALGLISAKVALESTSSL